MKLTSSKSVRSLVRWLHEVHVQQHACMHVVGMIARTSARIGEGRPVQHVRGAGRNRNEEVDIMSSSTCTHACPLQLYMYVGCSRRACMFILLHRLTPMR